MRRNGAEMAPQLFAWCNCLKATKYENNGFFLYIYWKKRIKATVLYIGQCPLRSQNSHILIQDMVMAPNAQKVKEKPEEEF